MTTDDEMIVSTGIWPLYPVLPVKKYVPGNMWPDHGAIVDGVPRRIEGPDTPIRVYLRNVYAETTDELTSSPHVDYPSAEAAVADGWLVD